MKKYWFTALCGVLVIAILAVSGTALAKYITRLYERDGTFVATDYYFRSNVMTENADPAALTVSGTQASFTLANGAGTDVYSDTRITYSLTYYVRIGSEWVEADREENCVFYGGSYKYRTVNFGPMVHEGTLYNDILVKATSQTPYTKSLYVRVLFDYAAHTLAYAYDSATGVITLTLSTNGEAGEYSFTWYEGIMPDHGDPNLILTDAPLGTAEGSSVDGMLVGNTTYQFVFFVTDADVKTLLASDPDKASEYVSCVPKTA